MSAQKIHPTFKICTDPQRVCKLLVESFLKEGSNPHFWGTLWITLLSKIYGYFLRVDTTWHMNDEREREIILVVGQHEERTGPLLRKCDLYNNRAARDDWIVATIIFPLFRIISFPKWMLFVFFIDFPERRQGAILWVCTSKVDVPKWDTTIIHTPIFEWYVVKCESKNGHKKRHLVKKILEYVVNIC